MNKKNIIQILKSGNQELFYSSFISWLLEPTGEHGLSSYFSQWFFSRIGEKINSFVVETEKSIQGGRADILITTDDGRMIVIENKTKSIGSNEQIKSYEDENVVVIPLGLVAENFPVEQRDKVITYSEICNFLKNSNPEDKSLSVLIDHFTSYLDSLLSPFNLLHKYCCKEIDLAQAKEELAKLNPITINDNDRRFFQAVYFERLLSYISVNTQELILGTSGYYDQKKHTEKPSATKWNIEKNLRGPAFMEAIIYKTEIPGILKVSNKWAPVFENVETPDMSPRLELWVGPDNIFNENNIGVFEIGCWDDELKKSFNSSNTFKKRGTRNFHFRVLTPMDIIYQNMTNLILQEMGKIWEFHTLP